MVGTPLPLLVHLDEGPLAGSCGAVLRLLAEVAALADAPPPSAVRGAVQRAVHLPGIQEYPSDHILWLDADRQVGRVDDLGFRGAERLEAAPLAALA